MAAQIRLTGLPEPVRQHPLVTGRRFRADFAWPELGVALETEGGAFTGGRHTSGAGFTRDCLKYSLAAIEGWLVVRATAPMVRDGSALDLLVRALEARRR